MVARLSTQAGPAAAAPVHHAPAQTQEQSVRPAGWGRAAGVVEPNTGAIGVGTHDQRERIQEQIAPAPADQARAAFSAPVTAAADSVRMGDYGDTTNAAHPAPTPAEPAAAPATRTRRRTAEPTPAATPPEAERNASAALDTLNIVTTQAALMNARATVMQGVIMSDPAATVADIIETTRELMDFVVRG